MNTFAIVATSFEKIDNSVHFKVILEGLTEKEILAIKAAIPLIEKICKTQNNYIEWVKIEGIDFLIRTKTVFELIHGRYKIISMWTINNFK